MSILSLSFFCFVAAAFAIHWMVSAKWRWLTILASSAAYVFIAAPETLGLLLFMVLISYFAARSLQSRTANGKCSAFLFKFSVLSVLLALAFFKYGLFLRNLIADSMRPIIQLQPISSHRWILPLGISFWSFSILSYLFDVRKGRITAEKHLGRYAAYILFFPKFLSGPIDRAGNFIPQIVEQRRFSYNLAVIGMRQIAMGLFRKIAIADALATFTNKIFGNPPHYCSMSLLFGAIFYSVQIYNDFAGYSDIAIGSARILGINLADNFRAPYFAKSLKEFWSRWHISLSTWFRDYLYIPMGGSRCSAWRTRFNLFVTFVASGLWHGANLTFIVWGAIHGFAQIAEKILWRGKRMERSDIRSSGIMAGVCSFLRWCVTFTVVTIAWTFFRANSIHEAWSFLCKLSSAWRSPRYGIFLATDQLGITWGMAIQLGLPIAFVAAWDGLSLKLNPFVALGRLNVWIRWSLYAVFIASILFVLLPQGESSQDFIYFKF